jgi:hypothetical protein
VVLGSGGNIIYFQNNGTTNTLEYAGNALFATTLTIGTNATPTTSVYSAQYFTSNPCAASGTAANPSVVTCGSSSAGIVACSTSASAGTCTVNTSAVTATSKIHITPSGATTDGTAAGVTCNTTLTFGTAPILAAKVAATSFTINMPTITTNPACFEYTIAD